MTFSPKNDINFKEEALLLSDFSYISKHLQIIIEVRSSCHVRS